MRGYSSFEKQHVTARNNQRYDVLENLLGSIDSVEGLCFKVNVWKLCNLDNLRVLKNNIRNGTPEMWRFYGGFMEIL